MLNHQKLLKTSFGVSKWLTTYMNSIGIQHCITPLPYNVQWFSDRKVLVKIIVEGLLFVCSYLIKALATLILIIPAASDENNTNPRMKKAIVWYL
jgi:hypothetical protein